MRVAEGKDAQVGDSPRLQQDTALLPCHFTYELLVKSNPLSSDLPRQGYETEQRKKTNI
jgi:hypothetical protein